MCRNCPATICDMLERAVARRCNESALGAIDDGRLRWISWGELAERVQRRAEALADFGVRPQSRVSQRGPNSIDWIVSDLALQRLGAVHVPIHTALSDSQAAELIGRSGAELVLVEPQESSTSRCLEKSFRVVRPPAAGADSGAIVAGPSGGQSPPRVPTSAPEPESLATILYTSGSTGGGRGVMLTHRNLAENVAATVAAVAHEADELRLCFLPLSHIYARTCDLYCWIYRGTRLVLAESRDTIVRDCQIARPTVLNAVPYFYQRLVQRLQSEKTEPQPSALRELLGGAVTHCYCGGAAVAPEVEETFERHGLPILSGYGLTETSPVVTATSIDNYERGTVGRPLANLDVRLAEDGEIIVRGPSVMQGYLDDPVSTAQSIRDGWFHTGDLGAWTPSGNLRIIGRKQEMIVLATGRKAAPAPIEARLLGSPLIEQACVVGEGRPYLTALIVPNADALRREIRTRRLFVWSRRRAVTHPTVLALYRREVDQRLADLASYEQVGAFVLLERGFSAERGELTPKLSLRRDAVVRNWTAEIQRLYHRPAATPPNANP